MILNNCPMERVSLVKNRISCGSCCLRDELCITLNERGYNEHRQFVQEFLFTGVCTQRGISAKSR